MTRSDIHHRASRIQHHVSRISNQISRPTLTMPAPIQTVHLVFKTHFDFGFTDFARAVVGQYVDVFIPQVLETAESLRREGKTERFIWTTGAWLIYDYLEHAASQDRKRIEAAIEAGDVAWHGLPFTTHSELMDASLFRYGLELSKTLDRRFGKQTLAAKMTDVPGHTRAIVPLLAEAGIAFLHIGVNEAATPPDVPPVFVWQDESGADVVVMYQHAYGEAMVVPGLPEALAFGFTHDNMEPQSPEQIRAVFRGIQETFPGAQVEASTLDAYAAALLRIKPRLPVVTGEIGIHQVPADELGFGVFAAAAAQNFSHNPAKRHFLDEHFRPSTVFPGNSNRDDSATSMLRCCRMRITVGRGERGEIK